jgi:hypothetical protein
VPTARQREVAKAAILELVTGCLESRIDAVFAMADKDDKSLPLITWRDLVEVREQICGAIADDLHHGLGDYVQEILTDLKNHPKKQPDTEQSRLKRTAASAITIASEYGSGIGLVAMLWAAKQFKSTAKSFNDAGNLTFDGAYQLIRLMADCAEDIAEESRVTWENMTRAEINVLREAQRLPPV